MKWRDEGTILRLSPLGEHGLIVTWSTAQHGIVRTAARNARKPGSDFTGRIDLFHHCEVLVSDAKRGDLHTLHAAELINARLPLRSNLQKLRLASYITRLLLATVESEDNSPEWNKLICGALDYVTETLPRAAILLHFEKRLAQLHGLHNHLIPPHNALLQHFQHLPAGRQELLEHLPQ
ncbi:MAG: DNA repair protein RecO [Akkermansia sp.]|nr:DNA repair protein RecO [Akkermansia sp.]